MKADQRETSFVISSDQSIEEIVSRWDANAPARNEELAENQDSAYRALTNLVTGYISRFAAPGQQIIDAGCGVGYLAGALAKLGHHVVGVDPSHGSIAIANGAHRAANLKFLATSLESVAEQSDQQFDWVVANMTLQCVPHLSTFLSAAASLLKPAGTLIATIPDPETYLQGRSDLDVQDIDLRKDHVLEIPFRIHGRTPHPSRVIYYHRTYRSYLLAAGAAGLKVIDFMLPDQVGIGKRRDVALLALAHDPQAQ